MFYRTGLRRWLNSGGLGSANPRQYAVPLLDRLFERPVFQSSHLQLAGCEPGRQGIHALVNLCEDKTVI